MASKRWSVNTVANGTSPGSQGGVAVLLDVDGALSPMPQPQCERDHVSSDGFSDMGHAAGFGFAEFDLSPTMLGTLFNLDATRVWLTTWDAQANLICDWAGLEHCEVLTASSQRSGWWKLDAMIEWVERNSSPAVVWCDDDLVEHRRAVSTTLHHLGVPTLCVSLSPTAGLTEADCVEIAAWVTANAT